MGTKLVERGITRYDIASQGTYGYMVRISRHGENFNEFFSDKAFNGKRKALQAARARYQELKDELPPARTTRDVVTSRNKSGVVGVHLAICESVYGEEYSSYCASWKSEDGTRSKISFSFKKYGKKAAWALACLARKLESSDREQVEAKLAKSTAKAKATKKKVTKKKTSRKIVKKKTKPSKTSTSALRKTKAKKKASKKR